MGELAEDKDLLTVTPEWPQPTHDPILLGDPRPKKSCPFARGQEGPDRRFGVKVGPSLRRVPVEAPSRGSSLAKLPTAANRLHVRRS
jgi:hypothetical protein